jgi:hypothetical protein
MKANTPELMKFKRLQRKLGMSVAQVVGHLELLWSATAKNAPEGDIGRFENIDIAIACYWDGDADFFVEALVECGWLDASDEWRLLVHDWSQHAPSYVHGILKRHGRTFRDSSAPLASRLLGGGAEPPKEPPKEPPIGTSSKDTPTKPSLVKPSLAKPSEVREDEASLGEPEPKTHSPEFKQVWNLWKKHLRENHKPLAPAAEEVQLMNLGRCFTTDEDRIAAVLFSIERQARNLITNGDHKRYNERQSFSGGVAGGGMRGTQRAPTDLTGVFD